MTTGGFSLDDKCRSVVENDIRHVIAKFRNLDVEKDRQRKESPMWRL